MINTTVQLKLLSGDEIVGHVIKANNTKLILQDVVIVDRMIVETMDEFGEANGTQIFYTMKPWLLYSFDWLEPQEIVLERSAIIAMIKPHIEIMKQYETSKSSLRQALLTNDNDVFYDIMDSDESGENYGIFETMIKPLRMN